MRVRDGRLFAAPVTDRPGIGAGALRSHAQRPAAIEAGNRASARAHGMNFQHGHRPGKPGYGGFIRRAQSSTREGPIRGRAAHIKRDDILEPVRTILSGPAGGVIGAQYAARLSGFENVITFDMGGTSTDVALAGGGLGTTNESTVAGLPVAVPMLEIHTVGAGGGSIARFDRGGAVRVGTESAGARTRPS